MPVADELYLLYQQSKDLFTNTIDKWEEHFQWLEEVRRQAQESRGQTIVPKTPARKRKNKKAENNENLLPPPIKEIEPVVLRKSSRAAAKTAKERNKQTLLEISNLSTKLRRPSTPKKSSTSSIIQENKKSIKLEKNEPLSSEENCVQSQRQEEETEISLVNEDTSKASRGLKKDDYFLPENKPKDEPESKQADSKLSSDSNSKKRSVEDAPLESVGRVTRTKRRKLSEENKKLVKDKNASQKVIHSSSNNENEESLHQHITENESDDNVFYEEHTKDEHLVTINEAVVKPSNRVTRSKVRQLTTTASSPEQPKLTQHFVEKEASSSSDLDKMDCHIVSKPGVEPCNRITRSKVRQKVTNDSSDQENKKVDNALKWKTLNKACHTPKGKTNSTSDSPHLKSRKNAKPTHAVQEVSVDEININSSPGKVVKHTWNDKRVVNTLVKKAKAPLHTPSPASSNTIKILGSKGIHQSGAQVSSLSLKRTFIHSSPQVIGTKVIGTPTEVNRTKNIICGTSFLTKVQPPRPTREESEERRQDDLRKKREREEETRRKKEELLRLKMEEQRRKNEERMRRVQEAREARERKVAEERERKMREERIKEGKRNLISAKKNEEIRQQALRKQMEEEQRLREELKIKEELKKLELKKEAERIAREASRREEAERIAREARERLEQEKLREAERIARERRELEQLRLKEAKMKSSPKKLNETYTADTEGRQCPTAATDSKQTYAMTPVAKKTLPLKKNANDYGIADIRSDDSTDEECAPKKEIPLWAKNALLKKQLFQQEHFPPNVDEIFPPRDLLKMPDLASMFPKRKRSRFTKRTSSAVWSTPPCRVFATSNR